MTIPRRAVCALILDEQDRALCVSRRGQPDAWELPAGKLEPGESHEKALAREVFEETCFVASPSLLIPLYANTVQGDVLYWASTYLYTGEAPALPSLQAEAGLRLCYMPLEHLEQDSVSPFASYHLKVRHALQNLREGARLPAAA
jgi:8-oxo-dGTP pyrophosphatase MutT (NUDIX family)